MSKLFSLMIIFGAAIFFVAAVSGPTEISAAQESKGKKAETPALYKQYCDRCHGANGKGVASFKALDIPDFTNAKWQASRTNKALTDSIAKGKGAMPGFANNLSDEELQAMTKYVRAFKPEIKRKK